MGVCNICIKVSLGRDHKIWFFTSFFFLSIVIYFYNRERKYHTPGEETETLGLFYCEEVQIRLDKGQSQEEWIV